MISVMSRLCQIHNEKTGCYLMSPCMGLARDRPVGKALRRGTIDHPWMLQGVPPSGKRVGLSCCRPEVITPPRGGGGGGRPAPEPQGAPRGVRAVPEPFPDDFSEDSLRDGGLRQKDIELPVDMLVDTVSRIQKDMAILREENRLLRTPAAV